MQTIMVEEKSHKHSSNNVAHALKKFCIASDSVVDKMENKVNSYENQLNILKEENKKLKEGKSYDVVFDESLLIMLGDSMKKIARLDAKLS
jgi:hypothetical protein